MICEVLSLITACKSSCGNIFTDVSHSVQGGFGMSFQGVGTTGMRSFLGLGMSRGGYVWGGYLPPDIGPEGVGSHP